MRYSGRYISFTLILVAVFWVNFYVLGRDVSSVGKFRGASLEETVFNPMIAEDVNSNPIRVVIDNKEYTSDTIDFFMNENRSIMAPVKILRDALNCSVSIYDENTLLVEKHAEAATLLLDRGEARNSEGRVIIDSPPRKINGEFYVSLDELSRLLGYSSSFDMATNTMTAVDEADGVSLVPTSYDLREKKRVSQVRNQGIYGTCWAFAAISALESSLLPEQGEEFSVDHMSMSNSFNVTQYDGGEYTMGMAYLAGWQGPVYERDDPYGDNESDAGLSPVCHVQEMRIIDGKDYQGIKEAVFKYGGVQTSLYSTLKSSQSYSPYFNRETNSYCYIGTEKPNHDVVIVGWDDNYPASNFPVPLEGDGAFICQNSWGSAFGEDGFFYVSYYDTNIGTHNVVYTRVDSVDNYDHIYQSDLCGWVGKLGYEKEQIYGANVFTAKGDENVAAAGFYATASDTEYEVYIVPDFKDERSFAARRKVAAGILERAGYYTVDFEKPVAVSEGEKYAVLLYLKTPGALRPMAIEYDSGSIFLKTMDLDDGEGYISYNGRKFENVKNKQNCNLCIKAFSDDR